MRIGILTLPLHINYGGILQAYALQTVLERMGHEVIVLQKDYKPIFSIPLWKYPFVFTKRLINKIFVDTRTPLRQEKRDRREHSIISEKINRFIQLNIHTSKIDNLFDIDLQSLDAIVVGSDQIWRPKYVKLLWGASIQDAFLEFAVSWKGMRVSYAASFGFDKWELTEQETEACKNLITLFDAVSVREKQAQKLCEEYLGFRPEVVLDPTLLLEAVDYRKFVSPIENGKRTLFSYILDESEEKLDLIKHIAVSKNLQIQNIRIKNIDKNLPFEERVIPPVEAWLEGILNADFIVTDSFHGSVFSIIFKKPFLAIANNQRGGSRFLSLFEQLGLEKHLITDVNDYQPSCSYSIPQIIDESLNKLRAYSLNFLLTTLKEN